MGAATTPTIVDGQAPALTSSSVPPMHPGWLGLATKALEILGTLATPSVGKGRDPVVAAVKAAVKVSVVSSLVIGLLIWGGHEVLGGRAATERSERINARIQALEAQQLEIRITLGRIAQAVGADPK